MQPATTASHIKLICADQQVVSFPSELAQYSSVIHNILIDLGEHAATEGIPIFQFTQRVLRKVFDWVELYHAESLHDSRLSSTTTSTSTSTTTTTSSSPSISPNNTSPHTTSITASPDAYRQILPSCRWHRHFLQDLRGPDEAVRDILYKVVLAANFLDIKPLCDMGCKYIAGEIRRCGDDAGLIRAVFRVKDDFIEMDRSRIWRENDWAVEGSPDGDEDEHGRRAVERLEARIA